VSVASPPVEAGLVEFRSIDAVKAEGLTLHNDSIGVGDTRQPSHLGGYGVCSAERKK